MSPQELSSQVCIIVDSVQTASPEVLGLFSGWQWESLKSKLMRAGFSPDSIQFKLASRVDKLPNVPVILGLGSNTLRKFTKQKSLEKYHTTPIFLESGHTYIPTFSLRDLQKRYDMNMFFELALIKCAKFIRNPKLRKHPEERFILNPKLKEALEILDEIKNQPQIACDVETGYGQINTVGFAWSNRDAVAINVLPDRLSLENYYKLWTKIAEVLRGPAEKIFQNHIYDTSYFSAYGIQTEGEIFDTMFAQKVLWPEFKSNLGIVGRIYTERSYWKDDGKVADEESAKKDWGNVRDWHRHYLYNCRDCTGSFEAARNQRQDLKDRSLESFFNNYIRSLIAPVREMCARGMPLDIGRKEQLAHEVSERLEKLTLEFQQEAGAEINPRSPKQKLEWLKSTGVTLPKRYDKKEGRSKETTDSTAIKRLRLKYPDMKSLKHLQEIGTLQKAYSSYINFEARPDGRLPFSINATGTETLRFSGGKDPWDRGINIQTMPREGSGVSIKSMFVAPQGMKFMEIDLAAAESRFVAYASADKRLIEMLEDGADVHRHVAMNILRALGKSEKEYSKKWRTLAKPVGHGGNYLMKSKTLAESIFKAMEIVISPKEADMMLEAYHSEFPGIRRWQGEIKKELWNRRRLKAPSGWVRYFYGRPDENMHREGIAWTPQHTIPWIINHLMFHLCDERKKGALNFHLIAQVHDSLILLVPEDKLEDTARAAVTLKNWHPEVNLKGGRLVIPVDCEVGRSLADKEEFHL